MKGSFGSISGVFESITGALGIFTAALAGGTVFREAIATTVELTTGAMALGRQFGISATQASDLRVALDDVHVTTETFSAAGNALVKTLNTNEEAFTSVGIATRTSSGEFRNQFDIVLDSTDHLAKLKEVTDRNVEGVMTALKNVVGQAVMPALTEMGNWFGSIGPGLVEAFRVAVAGVVTAFRLLGLKRGSAPIARIISQPSP
jgi:hypothetical protein